MANRKTFRTNRLLSVAMYLSLLTAALFGIGCSPFTCDILNCDTMFFIQDIIDALDSESHDDDHADNDTGLDDDHGDHGVDQSDVECPNLVDPPTLASKWIDYVHWDQATRVVMSAHEVSDESFHFMPSNLQFVAGKPYILVLISEEGNQEKHYFHAPDFYKAIATRKAQTAEAEYKAPYFDDFDLKVNGERYELAAPDYRRRRGS